MQISKFFLVLETTCFLNDIWIRLGPVSCSEKIKWLLRLKAQYFQRHVNKKNYRTAMESSAFSLHIKEYLKQDFNEEQE